VAQTQHRQSAKKGKCNTKMKMQFYCSTLSTIRTYRDVCRMQMSQMFSSSYSTHPDPMRTRYIITYVVNYVINPVVGKQLPAARVYSHLELLFVNCIRDRYNKTLRRKRKEVNYGKCMNAVALFNFLPTVNT